MPPRFTGVLLKARASDSKASSRSTVRGAAFAAANLRVTGGESMTVDSREDLPDSFMQPTSHLPYKEILQSKLVWVMP